MAEAALHICFVSPAIYPLFNPLARAPYGEAEIQIYELARYLGRNENLDIGVITNDYGQDEVEFYSGVMVYRRAAESIPLSFFQRWRSERTGLQNQLKKINADVYVMAGAYEETREVAEFCQKHRRALVYRVTHQRDCDGSFSKSLKEEGEHFAWALKQATRIVCQTETQKQLLRRTEKLDSVVLPNAVPLPVFPSLDRADVVWIGEMVEWKQPEMFFRLALTIPHQSFTILAYPREMDYFERLVEKTRDIPNLGFQNNVPYHEIPYFLERAKLLVNTSRFEGYPFSFALAHSRGVPVASLNIDPDGLLEKRQTGICAQGSEVRLAEEVLALCSFENQLKRFRDNAISFAHANHNIEKIGVEWLKLLISCAGEVKK